MVGRIQTGNHAVMIGERGGREGREHVLGRDSLLTQSKQAASIVFPGEVGTKTIRRNQDDIRLAALRWTIEPVGNNFLSGVRLRISSLEAPSGEKKEKKIPEGHH